MESIQGINRWKSSFRRNAQHIIDLQIIRKKHEFNICIDCEAVYMICDEETNAPIEKEVSLSELKDIGEFF